MLLGILRPDDDRRAHVFDGDLDALAELLRASASEDETVIFAWMRTSGSACVPIRSVPWLCSISSRWPGPLYGTVREKSRS